MQKKEKEIFMNRFLSKIPKESINKCWEWKGSINSSGYGVINEYGRKGKRKYAHRVAWEYFNNKKIPKRSVYHGGVIMHMCDNRKCVNPNHLVLGTQKENVQDMINKGRKVITAIKGCKHHNTQINEEIAKGIFLEQGVYRNIAKKYSCTVAVVKGIKGRKTWKHVTDNLS